MPSTKEKILIVEDDTAISLGLSHNLSFEGYDVRVASRGDAVFPILREFRPDLIILDLMLPGMDGFDILETLRAEGNEAQILILSAKSTEADKVRGLRLGADDYIQKPFGLKEFLARIDASLRRTRMMRQTAKPICFGVFELDENAKTLKKSGEIVRLTPKAFELLNFLCHHPDRTYSRDELLHYVWDDTYEGTARTIDNFILQIRNVIEENTSKPKFLETVHGMGYRFNLH